MGSLIGSTISAGMSYNANTDNLEVQQQENRLNRLFNAEQAQLVRDFTSSEREASQNYQSAEWDRQQAYNTPAMQVQRLQEGGINPAVYFGSKGSVTGGSSVSAPSGVSTPVASFNGGISPGTVQIPAFGDIGQFMKDVAEARKAVSETKTTDVMRDPLYRSALNSLVGQELSNESLKLANDFQKSSLDDRIKKTYWDAMESAAKVRLANSEEDLKNAEISYKQSMEALNYALTNNAGYEGIKLSNEVANWQRNFDSMIQLRKTEMYKNRAQASEAQQRALQSASETKLNKLDYEIKRNMQGALEGEYYERWQNLMREGKILDWQADCMESAAAQAKVNASHAELMFWKDFILDIGESGFGAFLSYKNMRSFQKLSSSAQSEVSRKIQQMKYEYGDKVKTEEIFDDGTKIIREHRESR